MYIMWHTRNQGWLTTAATYSSDRTQAKQFPEDAAFALAKMQYGRGLSEFGVIPIPLETIERIIK